jgi:DNA-binding HxlR family transcriptional regulator
MKSEAPKPGRAVRGSTRGRPIMAALDLLGRRGALRIMWELRGDERLTFRVLASAAELSPATLNTRLRELRDTGILESDAGYQLTPLGRELMSALEPLQSWAKRWAQHNPPRGP